jgi:hypothetical protein
VGGRTTLVIKLLQHLADDLADALQRLDIFLRLVVVLVEVADREADCARERGRAGTVSGRNGSKREPRQARRTLLEVLARRLVVL